MGVMCPIKGVNKCSNKYLQNTIYCFQVLDNFRCYRSVYSLLHHLDRIDRQTTPSKNKKSFSRSVDPRPNTLVRNNEPHPPDPTPQFSEVQVSTGAEFRRYGFPEVRISGGTDFRRYRFPEVRNSGDTNFAKVWIS